MMRKLNGLDASKEGAIARIKHHWADEAERIQEHRFQIVK